MTSSCSELDASNGCQEPRISSVPPFVASAGQEAIEVYALAGGEMLPWQQLVLRDAMGERLDGRWSATEIGLVVPRQNGKDEILCARELWGLFVGGERLLIHSAHQFDTAMEHLERLIGLIESVPEFRKRVRAVNRSHGNEGITLRNGARIRFRARTRSGGGRGYTGDCVIFNEAMSLPDEVVGAISFTTSARSTRIPGPQTWFAGSAVNRETMKDGLVLSRIRAAGVDGANEDLAYFEWSAPDDSDPAEWDGRRQANPSLGYLISHDRVEAEFRSPSVSAEQLAVERLGIGLWFDASDDAGRVIPTAVWDALADTADTSTADVGQVVFGIDANPDQTWGAIGVAAKRADGLFQIAIEAHERGIGWIVERCVALKREFPGCMFVVDKKGPANVLLEGLHQAGVRVLEANGEDYATACAGFRVACLEQRVRYPWPQPELTDALAGARPKVLGDGWKWFRRSPTSPDISPLVAVTLALWGAERAKKRPRFVSFRGVGAPITSQQANAPAPA